MNNRLLRLDMVRPAQWVWPALVAVAVTLLLLRDTTAAMVGIWWRSDTFAHAFLVPPIVLWLIWRRRAELAQLQPRAMPWMLLPIAATCFLWLLGELAGVNAATQFALVTLIVMSVPALFGWAVFNALLFPLLFLYFAVPMGEFLVPYMMEATADFTVAALQMTGIPVYREGLQFVIASGSWSVVEACSGVRYLIASFMVGTLFAYLNYRSTTRRVVFISMSILVPIVANWLRAYMIVMIGHLSDNKLAAGVDHLIYGWAFFGVVIGIMFVVGARWSEPDAPDPVPASATSARAVPAGASTGAAWRAAAGMALILFATQGVLAWLDRPSGDAAPQLSLPNTLGADWVAADAPVADWTPAFKGARATAVGGYRAGDAAVSVWAGYYRDQGYDRKMVTSSNSLVASMDPTWAEVENGSRSVALTQGSTSVRTAVVRGSGGLSESGSSAIRLRVWQVYWIGGHFTTSEARARVRLAFNRLLGRGDDAAVLIFYTPLDKQGNADAVLERFVREHLLTFGAHMERVARNQRAPA